MRPEIGPNKLRVGRSATRAAPELLERGVASAWTREGLHARVQAGLADASLALDAAADARLAGRGYKTGPIIKDLMEKRRQLTAETIEGSRMVPTGKGAGGRPTPAGGVRDIQTGQMKPPLRMEGRPIGRDVVPHPNAARVAQIDQAIAEIQGLGPVARYEALRRIRQAYDGPAKAVYNPSMTADFLKAEGGKLGAADVTGVLRESLAKFDPKTAAANAEYSIYRRANDVLEATAEVERTRPSVGRKIVARLTGTIGGGHVAGAPGAVAGFILAPTLEAALSSGLTAQLKVASLMQRLAGAIRSGNLASVESLTAQMRRMGAQSAVLTGKLSTSPTGLQPQPVGVSGGQ